MQKWGTWLSSTAACRVIDVIDDPGTIRRMSNDHHDVDSGFQFDSDTTFDRLGPPDRIDPEQVKGTDDEKKSKTGDIDSVFSSCKFQFTRDANVHASVILFLPVTIETESDYEWTIERSTHARGNSMGSFHGQCNHASRTRKKRKREREGGKRSSPNRDH